MIINRSIVMFMLFSWSALGLGAEPDWRDYAQILSQYVGPRTLAGVQLAAVDYSRIKTDPAFARAYAHIADFPPAKLTRREERLAFYINAYNLLAIKTVVDHWPVKSIKEVGSLLSPVWKRPAGQVAGKTVTLDEIEHQVLRKLGEPRIHLAIVCASLSCPDLRSEPYTAARLDAQLDAAVRNFLTNPTKGLRVDPGHVRVSKIFDWFEDDFRPKGGVDAFIRTYRRDLPPGQAVTPDLPYDWSLNGS